MILERLLEQFLEQNRGSVKNRFFFKKALNPTLHQMPEENKACLPVRLKIKCRYLC